jgi:hypothetical protein
MEILSETFYGIFSDFLSDQLCRKTAEAGCNLSEIDPCGKQALNRIGDRM